MELQLRKLAAQTNVATVLDIKKAKTFSHDA